MSPLTQEISNMVDMLPESEQTLAYEVLRRMVLAWDPDYAKATPAEIVIMDKALAEYEQGETVNLEDIN